MKKLLPHLLLALLVVGCTTEPEDVHGCLDSQACNYNSNDSKNFGLLGLGCGVVDLDWEAYLYIWPVLSIEYRL